MAHHEQDSLQKRCHADSLLCEHMVLQLLLYRCLQELSLQEVYTRQLTVGQLRNTSLHIKVSNYRFLLAEQLRKT